MLVLQATESTIVVGFQVVNAGCEKVIGARFVVDYRTDPSNLTVMRVALAVIVASIVVPLAVHATTAVEIAVGSAGTDAEGNAAISVTLSANGANVGGTQNDILFDNTILRLDASRCQLNPAISWERTECDAEEILLPCKNLTQMLRRCGSVPQPTGCPPDAGDNISRLRAIIAATVVLNINSIPDGVLYTCTFEVLDPERLPAALLSGNPIASSPLGAQFPAVAISGAVTAELLPTASPTATFTPTALPTETPTPSSTSTPTDTPTHTVTSTPTATATATPTASQTPTATPTEEAVTCAGDCNASLAVTVDEITLLVNVALGTRDAGDCPPGDRDGDQEITVDELVAALNNGLNGCPA